MSPIRKSRIIVTGAAGFIGSCMVEKLNEMGHIYDIIVVDDFYKQYKDNNLRKKFFRDWIHRDIFLGLSENLAGIVDCVILSLTVLDYYRDWES